jgi:hypothetical protein
MTNLQKNLSAIRKKVPLFADYIKTYKSVDWIKRVNSATDQLNLSVKTDYGFQLIYDNKKPDNKAIEEANKIDLHQDAVSVIIGVGAGYLLNEILTNCHKKHHVVIIEPIIDFLLIAFEQFDFSKYIEKNQLLFAVTEDDVIFHLNSFESLKPVEHFYLLDEKYIHQRQEYYKIFNHTKRVINQIQCNIGTVVGAGEIIAFNDIDSLPYVLRHRGVNELRNLFLDKPAICVSTGPSLQKNIHLLLDEEIQKKFIIIAVGQALRLLLAYGIRPDFITSVDFGEINMSHYKDLLDCDVPLVALNRSYAPLLRDWQKHKFICASLNPGFEETACGLLADKGLVEQGGSVAHLSFGLAKAIGCNPIIMIGQDLAYEDIDHSHTKQADTAGKLKVENGLIKWDVDDPSSIIKDEQQIIGEAQYIPGYWGKNVLTNAGFLAFILNFERMFTVTEQTVINCTEGGAKLKNCRQMLLKDALDKYGKDDIDKSVINPLLTLVDNSGELINESVKRLKIDIEKLEEIQTTCDKALKYCKRLKYDKSKKNLDEQYKWVHKAEMLCKDHNLINLAIYNTKRLIGQRYMIGEITDKRLLQEKHKDNFELRVKRTRLILERAKWAANKFHEKFKTSLEVLDDAPESLEAKHEELPSLDQCEEYLEAGNFANPIMKVLKYDNTHKKAYKIGLQAMKLQVDAITKAKSEYKANYQKNKRLLKYNQLLEDARTEGHEKKRFKRALKLLEQACLCQGIEDKTLALWGVATASAQCNNIKRSIEFYRALIADYPQNITYKFELMQVLLGDNRINEAIQEFQKIVERTDKYDYFYKIFARLYFKREIWQSALDCINEYLKRFAFDAESLKLKLSLLARLNRTHELPIIQKKIKVLEWT